MFTIKTTVTETYNFHIMDYSFVLAFCLGIWTLCAQITTYWDYAHGLGAKRYLTSAGISMHK